VRAAPGWLLAAVLASFGAAADDDMSQPPDLYLGADATKWGTPKIIVAPDYPPEALAHGLTGSVTVAAFIGPQGGLSEPSFVVDPPEATALEDAVKDVIRYWIFYPYVGDTCLRSPEPVLVRVWFEIHDGKPNISLSRPPTRKPATRGSGDASFKALERIQPQYPKDMIHKGVEGKVYVRLLVDPSGKVSRVMTQAFPHETKVDRGSFEREVENTLTRWTFTPAAAGTTRNRVACYEVVFNLRP
jgi:TonB family protein